MQNFLQYNDDALFKKKKVFIRISFKIFIPSFNLEWFLSEGNV